MPHRPTTPPPEQTKRHRLLAEGGALLGLALPLMVSQLARTGIGFVDTVMAGRDSEVSLAGVAIGSSLWIPVFLALMGTLAATTPRVAHAFGALRPAEVRRTVQQALWLALLLGVGSMLLLQNLGGLFRLLEVAPDVLLQAEGYIQAVAWGLPAVAGFQVLKSLNEGVHITRPFMYISALALLANIPLNYVLIYGELGLPALGGVGCGWATAIVLWLEFLALLRVTLNSNPLRAFRPLTDWRHPDPARMGDLLRLGLPIGISFIIESSMFALIALFLAKLGATVVSGHQIAISFSSLVFMIPLSLSMALAVRVGHSLGAGDPRHARLTGMLGLVLALATASLSSLLMLLFPDTIAALYSRDPAVLALAVELLTLAALFQFSDALQVSAAGALRGHQDTRFAFLAILVAYWGVGLPLGYTLGLTRVWGEPLGANGFWIGLIIGLSLAALLLGTRLHRISRRHI
ncbi:MAG: MATE family efflux transporter [Candidatus Sedimenticola endophacoides]